MPKLFYSPASPYSAKVRMAAHHAGYAVESVIVSTADDPAELIAANPLGKIPALALDDGSSVFDSPVIMQAINGATGGGLYPKNAAKRLAVLQREALADGICDCLLACIYEVRLRPEDKRMQSVIDRQFAKAMRGLDALCAGRLPVPAKLDGGVIAVRALIGYLELRFAGKWEKGRLKLKRFAKAFDEKHPDLAGLVPRG
ncbi:MAG: glutathione S-transferase [Rhizobiaceae bacterium]|jgi:glutathione S-transferase|nr:glutathione S-transferase [Rhizobiaceae bacterium]